MVADDGQQHQAGQLPLQHGRHVGHGATHVGAGGLPAVVRQVVAGPHDVGQLTLPAAERSERCRRCRYEHEWKRSGRDTFVLGFLLRY